MTAATKRAPELVRRQQAVRATMDRYRDRRFALGRHDCVRMAAFLLKQLGHRVSLAKAGGYRSALGAKRALARMGWANVVDAVDGIGLQRIPPAFARPGDLVSFPCGHELGALGIVVGNGNMLAFHEAHELPVVMSMGLVDACWRTTG